MWPASRPGVLGAQRDRVDREGRHALQVGDARLDLVGGQALDALGAELLDVVGGQRRAVGHRAR